MADSTQPLFSPMGLIIVFVLLAIAFALSVIAWPIAGTVTLSVSASVDTAEFELKPVRTHSWRLPPGTYSLLSGGGQGCSGTEPEILCKVLQNSTLQVTGAPLLTLESLSGGKFVLSLIPADGSMIAVVLGPSGEILAETTDLAFFQSEENAPETLLPMIAESATLGARLYESVPGVGMDGQTRQPMLHAGTYAGFASLRRHGSRFRVTEGQFYPGDVINMRSRAPSETGAGDAAIWGHISISSRGVGEPLLRITLHTPFDELIVQRFGSPGGFKIEISMLQIIASHPVGLSTWAIFLLLLVFYQAYGTAANRNPQQIHTLRESRRWRRLQRSNRKFGRNGRTTRV